MCPPRAISDLNLFRDTTVFYRRLAPRGAALFSASCNMSLRVDALALADGQSGPVAEALCVYAQTGLRTLLATKCAAALRNAAGQELALNAKQVVVCEHQSCTSTRVVLVEACTFRRRCIEHCDCDACDTALFAFAARNAVWSFDVPLGTTSAMVAAARISFDELRRGGFRGGSRGATTAAPVEEEDDRRSTASEGGRLDGGGAAAPHRSAAPHAPLYADVLFATRFLRDRVVSQVRCVYERVTESASYFIYSVPHVNSIPEASWVKLEEGTRRDRDVSSKIRGLMWLEPPVVLGICTDAELASAEETERAFFLHAFRRHIILDVNLKSSCGTRVLYCSCNTDVHDVEALLSRCVRGDTPLPFLRERLVSDFRFRVSSSSPVTVTWPCVHTSAVRHALAEGTVRVLDDVVKAAFAVCQARRDSAQDAVDDAAAALDRASAAQQAASVEVAAARQDCNSAREGEKDGSAAAVCSNREMAKLEGEFELQPPAVISKSFDGWVDRDPLRIAIRTENARRTAVWEAACQLLATARGRLADVEESTRRCELQFAAAGRGHSDALLELERAQKVLAAAERRRRAVNDVVCAEKRETGCVVYVIPGGDSIRQPLAGDVAVLTPMERASRLECSVHPTIHRCECREKAREVYGRDGGGKDDSHRGDDARNVFACQSYLPRDDRSPSCAETIDDVSLGGRRGGA